MSLYIGLMSGTSMDGIDAALVDVRTHRLIAAKTYAYSARAVSLLREVLSGAVTGMPAFSQLNTLIGREFAEAVHALLADAQVPVTDVIAIGSHGQTVCHDANADIPYTVQLGCGHTLAELTGITVVADFRARDLVVGGQGAPFAPLYHQALFKSHHPMAVVNVGGIANVTYLIPDASVEGYDTGPGNCLMDALAQKHLKQPYDANGDWAASGHVIHELLSNLQADPYFKRPLPKSIDKAYFSLDWLMPHLRPEYALEDVQATCLSLTACSIAEAINTAKAPITQVLLCGGGVHNASLMAALQHELPTVLVQSTQSMGVHPDFLEAMMFAWLADKTINHALVDLRQITGSRHPSILGAIYRGRS
jgi:anhydro-N-acetylmuramic acid kinase